MMHHPLEGSAFIPTANVPILEYRTALAVIRNAEAAGVAMLKSLFGPSSRFTLNILRSFNQFERKVTGGAHPEQNCDL